MRIDDLDADRARTAYVEDIFGTLAWLNIIWDSGPRTPAELARWSQELRIPRYQQLLGTLRAKGALYACTCSRRTVDTCTCAEQDLALDGPDRVWRLRVPAACPVTFRSWPADRITVDLKAAMPDPVLRQRNGRPAYQVASLADDVDQDITCIMRGKDLLASTACQVYLAGLLGLRTFEAATFVHHPLVLDAHGQKLSKSHGAASLQATRARGEGPAVVEALANELWARLLERTA